jgi:hypothetical protein
MSSEKLYFRVPHDKGHAHFYDTIESFPGLHAGPSFEDKEKYIRDTIRYQLLTTTPQQAQRSTSIVIIVVTLRECFRLQDRSHVEFCLEKKLPGTSLRSAAEELGLRK